VDQIHQNTVPLARILWRTLSLQLLIFFMIIILKKLINPAFGLQNFIKYINDINILNAASVLDFLHFTLSLIIVHVIWSLIITISCVPWITRKYSDATNTLIWLTIAVSHFTFVLTLNSLLYPTSLLAFFRGSLFATTEFNVALGTVLIVLFIYGIYRFSVSKKILAVSLSAAAIILVTGNIKFATSQADQTQPNIMIIGIDGLRPDHLAYENSNTNFTPYLNTFLEQSVVYDKTYTPMARTYVAWLSILTGQYPVNHGARFNLTAPEMIDRDIPLIRELKNRGYNTVYAMDERRFNHIDKGYGFDKVVGPKIGAIDELLSNISDIPTINILVNTPISKYLFPYLYINRGYGKAYSPELFNKEVLSSLSSNQPNFLSLHLCMLHWPYTSRSFIELDNKFWRGNYNHFMYLSMLKKLDNQFKNLIDDLRKNNLLDNTIMFIVSDHGEGLKLDKDGLTNASEGYEVESNTWGHGTNLLTQPQSHVLMAYARFKNGQTVDKPNVVPGVFSLVDIAPTLFKQLAITDKSRALDGVPLPVHSNPSADSREIFVESSIPVKSINTSFIDKDAAIKETISKYKIRDDGMPIIKPELYASLISGKQRSVYRDGWQLVLFGNGVEPALVHIESKTLYKLSEYTGDAPWQEMLASLCNHYRGDEGFIDNTSCSNLVEPTANNYSFH